MPDHVLNCRHCGRTFTTKRSDAIGCSRSCRRHLAKAARDAAPAVVAPTADADELDGWRRVPGGGIIPPTDERFTACIDLNPFGRF